jgi:hypothetical protein
VACMPGMVCTIENTVVAPWCRVLRWVDCVKNRLQFFFQLASGYGERQ